jgi:hypothetical protein
MATTQQAPIITTNKGKRKAITSITHFVPNRIFHLTTQKKVLYKGKWLKTSKIFDMVNMIVSKYYFTEESRMNLSTEILQKNYGSSYKRYMEYIISQGIINLYSKYQKGMKCNTYLIDTTIFKQGMKRFANSDTIVIKKWIAQLERHTAKNAVTKSIPLWIKKRMADNLWDVEINYADAMMQLNQLHKTKKINNAKYYKNLDTITAIAEGQIYYTEDDYGRFHTNFTILRKNFRKNLTIDGEPLTELDIPNSQPMFLMLMLREHNFDKECPVEFERYYQLVKAGKVYEEVMKHTKSTRKKAKKMFYSALFGENTGERVSVKANKMLQQLFPNIWTWVSNYKDIQQDHRKLARELQLRESRVLYNDICQRIMTEYPTLKLFTVHDSIFFPVRFKSKVEKIFNERVALLLP